MQMTRVLSSRAWKCHFLHYPAQPDRHCCQSQMLTQAVSSVQYDAYVKPLVASPLREGTMHSALEIVAFTHNSKSAGIGALLEVALKALDEEGFAVVAIHVDMALAVLRAENQEIREQRKVPAEIVRRKRLVH